MSYRLSTPVKPLVWVEAAVGADHPKGVKNVLMTSQL